MILFPGTKIGVFEIVEKVGEGGMGEVYRARDTRLGREVALKILPDVFTTDPERHARFEREARVLASLNHPNIAQVFGFELAEDHGGALSGQAIIMELVEGQTLAELLRAEGRLPLDRTLAIARQIAAAMDAAHDGGIIHRDLKPANIKVRSDGTVKVLDFGLAKALVGDATRSHSNPSNSPTITAHSAEHATILGTAAYMSPEQAKGRAVDRRADVWAFGVVLFEMLAGRRAFAGDDVSEVLAAVLMVEPDWSLLPPDLPPPVRRLLRRCLEKDARKRLRDIAEGMLQLEDGLAHGSTSSGVTTSDIATSNSELRTSNWWHVPAAAVATALIVLGIGMWRGAPAAPAGGTIRIQHAPLASAPVYTNNGLRDVAISPDGRRFAYVSLAGGTPSLYIRSLDQLDASMVQGSQGAIGPFFSPDGEWLGFIDEAAPGQIKKISVRGGPAALVATFDQPVVGAAWTDDGIVAGVRDSPLHFIRDAVGAPVPLTKVDTTDVSHIWPAPVPGTQIVLFAIRKHNAAPINTELAAFDRASGTLARLKIDGLQPRYISTGSIVYATVDGAVRSVPFDTKRLAVTGPPVPLFEGVGTKGTAAANFDVSAAGHLVYTAAGTVVAQRTLVWVDRAGRETPTSAPPRNYFYARVSPDATRLALSVRDEKQDIWIWDTNREVLLRLTQERGTVNYGLWTRDNRIVYDSEAAGPTELFWRRADGAGRPEQITKKPANTLIPFPNAVSPDGRHVIFRSPIPGPRNDLFVVELTGAKKVRPFFSSDDDERNAAFSPDGSLVAFESDATGKQFEIFVRPFADADGALTQVSIGGGIKPVWSPDGREIYYLAGNKLMAVPVTRAGGLKLGKPVPLFDTTPYFFGDFGRNYDVDPKGHRFVMVKNPAGAQGSSLPITIVLNWVEELRAKVK